MLRALRFLLIAAAFLLLAEFLLRRVDCEERATRERWKHSYGLVDPSVAADPYLGLAGTSPLYSLVVPEDGGLPFRERSPNKKAHYRPQIFGEASGAKEYRVFMVGGSSVRCDAFVEPDGSFCWMLQRYINGALRSPGDRSRFGRVINAGGGGMGSLQNLEVLREILEYSPNLVVVYPEGGEKNFIGESPRAALAKADDSSSWRPNVRRVLAPLRTYQMVRDAYRWLLDDAYARVMPSPAEGQAANSAFSAFAMSILADEFSPRSFSQFFEFKDSRVPPLMERVISEEEVRVGHERFKRSLHEMARLAREKQVPLVFVLPVRNLKQSFYLRFHVTPEEIREGMVDTWRSEYEAGCAALRARDHRRALPHFQKVRECYTSDNDEILSFYIAQCLEATGQANAALAEYSRPYLLHPMRQQIIDVGKEEGVIVVDPYTALIQAAGGVAPGYEWFTDAFHPMPNTSKVVAHEIMEAIQRKGWIEAANGMGSRPMQNADEDAQAQVERCPAPPHNLMLRAIERGDYQEAVDIAESLGPELIDNRLVEALYYGWALTKKGDLEKARATYKELRRRYWRPGMGGLDLSTDEALVRYAFEGDIFHYF